MPPPSGRGSVATAGRGPSHLDRATKPIDFARLIDAARQPWLALGRVDESDEEQRPRASDPGDARYVPPSLIPRPQSPAEVDPAPVRLAREIDPRQQTTRRVMVLRRFWHRHRWLGPAALLLLCTLVVVLFVLKATRSSPPALPEPAVATSPEPPLARPSAPRPEASTLGGARTPAEPGVAASAREPDPAPSTKARARRVWLE